MCYATYNMHYIGIESIPIASAADSPVFNESTNSGSEFEQVAS